MRTQEEILAKLQEQLKNDILGFEINEYIRALPKEILESLKGSVFKEDADFSDYEPDLDTDEKLQKQCVDYMSFAWDKAINCRSISAGRSISHYIAWLWMLGHDYDGLKKMENYQYYGKNELCYICGLLGLDSSQWDDGKRVNSEEELYGDEEE